MFSEIYSTSTNELQNQRLEQLKQAIRNLPLHTREEFLAEFHSALNAVLQMGNRVSPVRSIQAETPAIIGHVQDNLASLSTDATAIATQIYNLETQAGQLFNLFATTQNGVRQQIREAIYAPTRNKHVESFIHSRGLESHSGHLDFAAGTFSLPLVKETEYKPSSLRIGESSTRRADQEFVEIVDQTSALIDDKVETSMAWEGPRLELVFTFKNVVILNRLQIELDQYQGLVITELTASPDGILRSSLLEGLDETYQTIDGFSGKHSGDYFLDFLPRHVKQIKLVLEDKIGAERITLRNIRFFSRRFEPSATVTTRKIESLSGTVRLTTKEVAVDPLTSITHQISYDGVNFFAVTSGTDIELASSPFWYRAYLERLDANFDAMAEPVEGGSDPNQSDHFTLDNSSAVDIGNGILDRSITLTILETEDETAVRAVQLREQPFPGTLRLLQGAFELDADSYSVSGSTITFPGQAEIPGVTLRYQTSVYENAGLKERKAYYTPLLEEISFERQI